MLIPPCLSISALVASSSIVTQSHRMFPWDVLMSKARWPIANFGCVGPMLITWSATWKVLLQNLPCISLKLVHFCPEEATYCRSSWQIRHDAGGLLLASYCTPQVSHIQFCMLPSNRWPAGTKRIQQSQAMLKTRCTRSQAILDHALERSKTMWWLERSSVSPRTGGHIASIGTSHLSKTWTCSHAKADDHAWQHFLLWFNALSISLIDWISDTRSQDTLICPLHLSLPMWTLQIPNTIRLSYISKQLFHSNFGHKSIKVATRASLSYGKRINMKSWLLLLVWLKCHHRHMCTSWEDQHSLSKKKES